MFSMFSDSVKSNIPKRLITSTSHKIGVLLMKNISMFCTKLSNGKKYYGETPLFCWKMRKESKDWEVSSITRRKRKENDCWALSLIYQYKQYQVIRGTACYLSSISSSKKLIHQRALQPKAEPKVFPQLKSLLLLF